MARPEPMRRVTRWMYKGGRPNWIARAMNRFWGWLHGLGIMPKRLATLEVRGRTSGRQLTSPVVIADWEGNEYLVSMLGRGASWVANVRAADGRAVLRRGRRDAVRLVEVDPAERAPILRRYVEVAPSGRQHFPVRLGAPLEEYEPIAPDYPVFRIERDSET